MSEIDYGIDPELIFEFVDESKELLSDVTNLFIAMEGKEYDKDSIDKIFRSVHTIKGNSAFFNLMKVKALAHVMEDLMNLVREGHVKFNEILTDALIRGIDELKEMLDNVRAGEAEVKNDKVYNGLMDEITLLVKQSKEFNAQTAWQEILRDINNIRNQLATANPEVQKMFLKIFDNLVLLSPLNSIEESEAVSQEKEKKTDSKEILSEEPGEETKVESSSKVNKTMRVYESTIDEFLDYLGELVVVGEMYEHIQKRFAEELGPIKAIADLKKNNEMFSDISTTLQRSVLSIRRIPIKTLVQKAPRIIRDIASQKNKKINVIIDGDNTLIDKSTLESLEGPFVHLIRNAADHGVEDVDTRVKAGKTEYGNITITVSEDDQDMFIGIVDDGGGINKEKVLEKAIKNGLISASQAGSMTEPQIFNLLFAPGFSTAEKVTDISGRGVGMDVVKKNIDGMGGIIDISSMLGEGSTFTLKIPKKVAVKIIEGFLVLSQGNRFVLPMGFVGESFQIKESEITETPDNGECILHHNKMFPVVKLDKLLGLSKRNEILTEQIGVIYETRHNKIVLMVDGILGTQKVVVKDIQGLPLASSLIAGGAILGDERVAIVLNLESL